MIFRRYTAIALALFLSFSSSFAAKPPTVVRLVFKGYEIFVAPGDKGSVYTVQDQKGQVLADQVSALELQGLLPDVHHFVKGAFAGDRNAYLDASNRR